MSSIITPASLTTLVEVKLCTNFSDFATNDFNIPQSVPNKLIFYIIPIG